MSPWGMVLIIGAGTYLSRLSFIALFGRSGVPPWLATPLRYVAPSVLAALAAPSVISPNGAIDLGSGNPRLFAAIVALLVAWRTQSVVWTIVSGMAALWAFQAVL